MGVGAISADVVAAAAVEGLGLDASAVDVLSPEALAASIRRAASVLCPATPGAVMGAVREVLKGLPGYADETRTEVDDLITAMVSYGDLLELPLDEAGGPRRHLFLGPPSFVRRTSGCIVMGIRPDGAPLVGGDLSTRLEFNRHVRLIPKDGREDVADSLIHEGLIELAADQWLRPPRSSDAQALIKGYVTRLAARQTTGDIEEVRILDPESNISYYRGRWRTPQPDDTGYFVGRRPQAYGAELWSFFSLGEGRVRRLLDLPVADPLAPGADEAWRLQAAIDAVRGCPQRIRVRSGPRAGTALMDFFAPLPSWAQRRLDTVAIPVLRSRGALLAYQVPDAALADEVGFLREMLWLECADERKA